MIRSDRSIIRGSKPAKRRFAGFAVRSGALGVAAMLASVVPARPQQAANWQRSIDAGIRAEKEGRVAAAEVQFKSALAAAEKINTDHPFVVLSLNQLGELYRKCRLYPEAEAAYRRALALREKTLGSTHPETATALQNLALVYRHEGRFDDALKQYARAQTVLEKAFRDKDQRVPENLSFQGLVYFVQGRYSEAGPWFGRALAILYKLMPGHPSVAINEHNLAAVYINTGRYREAEPLLKSSLAIWQKWLGPNHPNVASTLDTYAILLRRLHRVPEADRMAARSHAIRARHTSLARG